MNSSYVEWCTNTLQMEFPNGELGIKSMNSDASESKNSERGVVSHNLKKDGPILVKLPFQSIMTILSSFGTPFESILNATREDDLLALLLLYEKFVNKDNSKWAKHIEILPEKYHNIANYTDVELEYIKGSNLYMVAKKWKIQIKTDYEDLKLNLQANQINMKIDVVGSTWFTYEN